jgi:hypothetical protein
MKKDPTSSRYIRFSPAGLKAIKSIAAESPGSSLSTAVNDAMIRYAKNKNAAPTIRFSTLEAHDLIWISAMIKDLSKDLRELRRQIVGKGLADTKPELLTSISEKLKGVETLELKLTQLASLNVSITPEEAILLKNSKSILGKLLRDELTASEVSDIHLVEFKLLSILFKEDDQNR